MRQFSNFDLFGVPMSQRINEKETLHRSVIGGIVTVIILIASLAYSFWVFYQWGSNSMNPTIITEQYLSNFEQLDINYDVIKASYLLQYEGIDPIKSNIIIPVVQYSMNDPSTGTLQYFEQIVLRPTEETNSFGSPYLIPKMNITYNNQYTQNWEPSNQIYLMFISCQQELLSEGEECASQELIDEFYQTEILIIIIEIDTRLLNPQDKSIQENAQLYYLQLEPALCVTLNVNLKSTFYEISDYFIFGNTNNKELITGIEAYSQTNTQNYCQKMFQEFNEVYGFIVLQMLNTQQKTILQYPGAGQLFANIGSIVSILFTLRFLIFKINEHDLNNELINSLIEIYYPQFSKIKVIKNWRQKIVAVYLNSQPIDLNQYIKFKKQIKKMLQQKLSWVNMNYEISRLYFMLRQFFTREEIRQFHHIGISLDLNNPNMAESCRSSTNLINESEMFLKEEDSFILTLKQRGSELGYSLQQPCGSKFFDINQIIQ